MTTKKNAKSNYFGWPARAIFLVVMGLLLIFGWNRISWVFSGEVWQQYLSDAFPQFFPRPYVMAPRNPAADIIKSVQEQKIPASNESAPVKSATSTEVLSKPRQDRLTIPKLGISAPIITAATANNDVIHGLLDSGVVLYPGSTPFGQKGTTVILGHSAPTGWPKIKYDWVFSRINELKTGDLVVVTYDRQTRYYSVVRTRVVTPQEGVPEPTVSGNSLMLVSCWPPGKDYKRIAVETTIIIE